MAGLHSLCSGVLQSSPVSRESNHSSLLTCSATTTVAFVSRPLKRDQDIGSDTDFTQSSMEDISARCSRRQEDASICDHRTQEQKHYRAGGSQPHRAIQREGSTLIIPSFTHLLKWNLHVEAG